MISENEEPIENDNGDRKEEGKKSVSTLLTIECTVCGDAAPEHLHFGAHSCYSCRAFFRRTVEKKESRGKLKCKSGTGNCNVNFVTRNCIHCRYEKCIAVGMTPSLLQGKRKRDEPDNKSLESNIRPIGSPPAARGSLPVARGSPPAARGSPPAARGSPPAARGSLPVARGSPPAARGSPPAARGSPPAARGSPPAAIGSPTAPYSPPQDNSPSALLSSAPAVHKTSPPQLGGGCTGAGETPPVTGETPSAAGDTPSAAVDTPPTDPLDPDTPSTSVLGRAGNFDSEPFGGEEDKWAGNRVSAIVFNKKKPEMVRESVIVSGAKKQTNQTNGYFPRNTETDQRKSSMFAFNKDWAQFDREGGAAANIPHNTGDKQELGIKYENVDMDHHNSTTKQWGLVNEMKKEFDVASPRTQASFGTGERSVTRDERLKDWNARENCHQDLPEKKRRMVVDSEGPFRTEGTRWPTDCNLLEPKTELVELADEGEFFLPEAPAVGGVEGWPQASGRQQQHVQRVKRQQLADWPPLLNSKEGELIEQQRRMNMMKRGYHSYHSNGALVGGDGRIAPSFNHNQLDPICQPFTNRASDDHARSMYLHSYQAQRKEFCDNSLVPERVSDQSRRASLGYQQLNPFGNIAVGNLHGANPAWGHSFVHNAELLRPSLYCQTNRYTPEPLPGNLALSQPDSMIRGRVVGGTICPPSQHSVLPVGFPRHAQDSRAAGWHAHNDVLVERSVSGAEPWAKGVQQEQLPRVKDEGHNTLSENKSQGGYSAAVTGEEKKNTSTKEHEDLDNLLSAMIGNCADNSFSNMEQFKLSDDDMQQMLEDLQGHCSATGKQSTTYRGNPVSHTITATGSHTIRTSANSTTTTTVNRITTTKDFNSCSTSSINQRLDSSGQCENSGALVQHNHQEGMGTSHQNQDYLSIFSTQDSPVITLDFKLEPEVLFSHEESLVIHKLQEVHSSARKITVRNEFYKALINSWQGTLSHHEMLKVLSAGRAAQNHFHYLLMSRLPFFSSLSSRIQRLLMENNTKLCLILNLSFYFYGHEGRTFIEQEEASGGDSPFLTYCQKYNLQGIEMPSLTFEEYFLKGWAKCPDAEKRFQKLSQEIGNTLKDNTGMSFCLMYAFLFYSARDNFTDTIPPADLAILEQARRETRLLYNRYTKHVHGWKKSTEPSKRPECIRMKVEEMLSYFVNKNAHRTDLTDHRTANAIHATKSTELFTAQKL